MNFSYYAIAYRSEVENAKRMDNQVFMTSSPRSASPLLLLSMAVLIWIILLAGGLQFFLRAELTGGWLVIALMVTAAAIGLVLIVKDTVDTILAPGLLLRTSTCAQPVAADHRNLIDPLAAQRHRSALGLPPHCVHGNRRRSQTSLRGLPRRCANGWQQAVLAG